MCAASMTTAPRWTTDPVLHRPPLPLLSLGPHIVEWCEANLRQPDGPDAGEPWRFTREQERFLWCLYALDESGRFLWSRAVLRRPKGWGKSPFVAALALAELCGPVRFDGIGPDGHAKKGVPVTMPWVQLAGVSEKQTTNTMSMVLAMIAESPAMDTYGLDPGLTRIFTRDGGRLEPITASAPTAEGARPTFVVMDETHHWSASNGGHHLAEVIRRNLGKSRDGAARSVETTNAHEMGVDSVAERSYEGWQAQASGRARGSTILYDSREAPPKLDLGDEVALLDALAATYGDSTWVDLERIRDEIYDPGTPVSTARRFYLNQLAVAEDAWVAPREWDKLADASLGLGEGDIVTLGFDGSKTGDDCALVATRVPDGAWFTLGVWDPARYGGEAPRELIDEAVLRARDRYDVVGFYSDLALWESYVDKWAVDFGDRRGRSERSALCVKACTRHPIAWDMRGRGSEFTTLGIERLYDEIVEGVFRHDGHPVTAAHVHNARRRPNRWGVSVGKENRDSTRKIDALVAGCLSRMARRDYLALPPNRQRRQRSGKAAF